MFASYPVCDRRLCFKHKSAKGKSLFLSQPSGLDYWIILIAEQEVGDTVIGVAITTLLT
jgi:hypothetical protein